MCGETSNETSAEALTLYPEEQDTLVRVRTALVDAGLSSTIVRIEGDEYTGTVYSLLLGTDDGDSLGTLEGDADQLAAFRRFFGRGY